VRKIFRVYQPLLQVLAQRSMGIIRGLTSVNQNAFVRGR